MSRIDTLKKQFPHLNITILDLLSEIDGTKSHKYLQLLCKVFKKNWIKELYRSETERLEIILDNQRAFRRLGISEDDDFLVNITKRRLLDLFRHDDIELFQEFKSHLESDRVEISDLTKYETINDIRNAVSYASIKQSQKSLEKQIHKEFEDDTWVLVRPLSFESSSVYGSGTKWCTTFKREKEYFFKYFYSGALVYVINKKTGYKFAMYVEIQPEYSEISFWSAEDSRVDFLSLETDDHLLPILKRIKNELKKNSDFLNKEELAKVAQDCNSLYRLENNLTSTSDYPQVAEELIPVPTMAFRA